MGAPVVHFEVVGKDAEKLRSFYSELADWKFDVYEGGPTDYGVVAREGNTNSEGAGIGGGVGNGPEGYEGHVTFYIEVPDVGEALDKAESLGGTKVMGPDTPMEGLTIGLFGDPEGHVIGLVQARQS
jgi:predicted enzyme related to lactoylglutathione lyase